VSLAATRAFAAVDLGAESGRVVLARFDGARIELEVAHRFPNRSLRLPDGLHWDLTGLYAETLEGIARAAARAPLHGIGIDSWGVDYALLDAERRLLGLPYHYRDARTAGMVERVDQLIGREELYAATGIQTMTINTIYQLLADPLAAQAERIALIPDLFALWMTGELANEITAASTTGLLDARSGAWSTQIAAALGLPPAPFASALIEPATRIGELAAQGHTPVFAVAGHDTASAFAAAPLRGEREAILSSGTWSLLGIETAQPYLGADAAAFNLTNERGLDGTTRLLRNVMGLWLLQECRRRFIEQGGPCEYAELLALAQDARADVALFDPDAGVLLAPGEMPERIATLCERSGQAPPAGRGELVRSILLSLACKYRLVLERIAAISGRSIEVLHVVGGGAGNELLCRLTADITGCEVRAGSLEATALGNALVQARAVGELAGPLAQLREVAAASTPSRTYEPGPAEAALETYERFLSLTKQGVR
jgi:rhamnulokinase